MAQGHQLWQAYLVRNTYQVRSPLLDSKQTTLEPTGQKMKNPFWLLPDSAKPLLWSRHLVIDSEPVPETLLGIGQNLICLVGQGALPRSGDGLVSGLR